MERVNVTESELLEAIRGLLAHTPESADAATITEMLEAMPVVTSRATLCKSIAALIKKGDAECVHVHRIAMDGRRRLVPGYRMRKAA